VPAPPKDGIVDDSANIFHCEAFRIDQGKSIPLEILYGKNLHLKPVKGDNGIQYEKAKSEDDFDTHYFKPVKLPKKDYKE
tara:strand:+ start:301 stop:540 length:240 start_codon:yes stop_codon:yes gene_type:complete